MNNVDLNQVNKKYILNQQSNTSSPVETDKNVKQVDDGNNKLKKGLVALAVLGSAVVAGIAIYKGFGNKTVQEVSETVNEVKAKLLKDVKFDKGIASLPDGSKFTGVIEDTLKNGDKITLRYTDGVIQKSQRSGSKTIEKVYETRFNGDKIVVITENNTTRRVNLTEIKNNVKKAQDDFKKLLEDDKTTLWRLKNHDRAYLNNTQKTNWMICIKRK